MVLNLTVPPELRVAIKQIDMPEHRLTRAIEKDIEDKKHQPIKDNEGNIQYILAFADDAQPANAAPVTTDRRFGDSHDSRVLHLLYETEAAHNISATHLYSHVLRGFAAFLSPEKALALGQDKRIKLISPNMPVQFSGGIWSDLTVNAETTPWGIKAVGGNRPSVGTATVYVVDSGILPVANPDVNVTSRWTYPGCQMNNSYNHGSMVAGIIGALSNNSGVVGVDTGANLVSLTYNDGDSKSGLCLGNAANAIRAFEEAKRRIGLSGHVGVVNFSSNLDGASNAVTVSNFRAAVRGLITPVPSTAYPGAVFIQSAGNDQLDACGLTFNSQIPSPISPVAATGPFSIGAIDGAMTVGAMDNNGQPVQPMNGNSGFNVGNSFFRPDAGSNHGSCVDLWAPGKDVTSLWPATTIATGSGTSFAAPHIAGVAAYLIETFPNLNTPALVEQAIRDRRVGTGALSNGLPVMTANIIGATYMARPTVEFKIGSLSSPSLSAPPILGGQGPNSLIYADGSFVLRYDSVGTQACSLKAFVNNNPWYTINPMPLSYDWGAGVNGGQVQLTAGLYRWETTCSSAAGTVNTAIASAQVTATPPAPVASFAVSTALNGLESSLDTTQQIGLVVGQTFSLRYSSSNTTSCTLTAYIASLDGFLALWYENIDFSPSFDWGMVTLPAGKYQWRIDCKNINFPKRPHVYKTLDMYIS